MCERGRDKLYARRAHCEPTDALCAQGVTESEGEVDSEPYPYDSEGYGNATDRENLEQMSYLDVRFSFHPRVVRIPVCLCLLR